MHGLSRVPSRLIRRSGSALQSELFDTLEQRMLLSGADPMSPLPAATDAPAAVVEEADFGGVNIPTSNIDFAPVPRGASLPNIIYYPEGWRNDSTINEYVPMSNPNNTAVQFRVIAHYETGARDEIISEGTIPATSRGGITISEHANPGAALVRLNEGYALEIQSSLPIGATLSHYDSFTGNGGSGAAVGEAFTSDTSREWFFADASNINADFFLFYNPNPDPLALTVTFFDPQGNSHDVQWNVDPFRRSGIAMSNPNLGLTAGQHYGVYIQDTNNREFLAALSSYSTVADQGSTALGQQLGVNVYPSVEYRTGLQNNLTLFNPSPSATIGVTVVTTYVGGTAQPATTTYTLTPRQRQDIDVNAGHPSDATGASIRITGGYSRLESIDPTRGDSTVETPAGSANKSWAFSDGFLDRNTAGTVGFETIGIYNASSQAQNVQIKYLFNDGTTQVRNVFFAAHTANQIRLDHDPLVTQHANLNFFSVVVSANFAIVASMTHWDLFQGGGWASLGTPLGATGPA